MSNERFIYRDEKVLEKIKRKCDDTDNMCWAGFYNPQSGFVTTTANGVCLGQMINFNHLRDSEISDNLYFTSPEEFRRKGHETNPSYIPWLVNDSPVAEVFVEKDVDFILDNFFVLDATLPHNLVICAGIFARHLAEFPERLRVFQQLVDNGINGNVAFVLTYNTRANRKGVFQTSFWGNHNGMREEGNLGYHQNFCQGFMPGLGKLSLVENRGYSKINSLWGESGSNSTQQDIDTYVKTLGKKPKPEKPTDINPFAPIIQTNLENERKNDCKWTWDEQIKLGGHFETLLLS